ncbi:MAG: DUF1428 domain-containing protein [Sphingopyxis sp.]
MAYIDGYIIPVPVGKRAEYEAMARFAAPIFIEHGALQVVENWGDDVPKGKHTDLFMAVKAEEGENVVFSWMIWPSKEVRDTGNAAAMADPRFKDYDFGDTVDGKRMIFGGFTPILDMKG